MEEKVEQPNPTDLLRKIELIIKFIDTAKKEYKKSHSLVGNLEVVKQILTSSRLEGNKVNMAKLHEAIHFIETIPVEKKRFFWEKNATTLAELFVEKEEAILPESERAQTSPTAVNRADLDKLPRKYHETFGRIHATLYDLVQEHMNLQQTNVTQNKQKGLKPAWEISYPKTDNEIMSQEIGKWQATQMKLRDSTDKASKDYLRNVSVRGMFANTEDDIKHLLQYLVDCSKCNNNDKETLLQWLAHNGHQGNKDFINQLAHAGALISEEGVVLGVSKTDELNWTIENGEIVMNIDFSVHSLIIDGRIYTHNDTMNMVATDSPENIKKTGTPLLRFQSQVKLHINDEKIVEPQVTRLVVTSGTNDLQPSNQLLPQNSAINTLKQ